MTFPLLFSVGLHVYSAGSEDAHGNNVAVYTPAKTAAGTSQPVYGWSTPSSAEPLVAGQDRTIVDIELLVPPGFPATPRDVVDLPGDGQFEVIGYAADWGKGPFGWKPGLVVNLRRVDG